MRGQRQRGGAWMDEDAPPGGGHRGRLLLFGRGRGTPPAPSSATNSYVLTAAGLGGQGDGVQLAREEVVPQGIHLLGQRLVQARHSQVLELLELNHHLFELVYTTSSLASGHGWVSSGK